MSASQARSAAVTTLLSGFTLTGAVACMWRAKAPACRASVHAVRSSDAQMPPRCAMASVHRARLVRQGLAAAVLKAAVLKTGAAHYQEHVRQWRAPCSCVNAK